MAAPRIHTDQPLSIGMVVTLERNPSRHLIQVLRLRAKAAVSLFNGDGHDYQGVIDHPDKNRVTVVIEAKSARENDPKLPIHLGLGISKGERMDFAIQKSVELGVTEISPVITERCMVRIPQERMLKRLAHWNSILIAACEQSGRKRVPLLNSATELEEWISGQEQSATRLLLDHRSHNTLNKLPEPKSTLCLLVGPEGGLSEAEQDFAFQAGFMDISLGPRILRTETAPLAALAAIQTLWGDFR